MRPIEKMREAMALRASGITQAEVAARMGVPPRTVSDWVKWSREASVRAAIPEAAVPPDGFAVARVGGQYDQDGKLLRQYVTSKRDAGEVFEVPAGHVVKGESALIDADGRVMQRWVKTKEGVGGPLIEDVVREAFSKYGAVAPQIDAPAACDDDLLTEYLIPDLHLGAFSWGTETGEDYDLGIAVDVATRSIQTLVSQSRPSTHAALIFLGDYTHANDEKAVTPGSGHRLDTDGRWQKVYAAAAKLAVSIIDIVSRKHQSVTVRVLKGNHDIDAAVTLAVLLSLLFRDNPRITIEEDPGIAWYRRFGKCLLAANHGHTMKPEAMAMAMAVDRAEDWGQTVYRHIAFGHIHHHTAKEIMGVRVESFQAVAARDAWNAESGYRSGRSLSALTWHREDGEIGRHRVNISGGAGVMAA